MEKVKMDDRCKQCVHFRNNDEYDWCHMCEMECDHFKKRESIDKEKVIMALELEDKYPHNWECTDKCPYYGKTECNCWQQVIRDALALLKAQEPRVMTLEEVFDMKFDDVVYLQVYPTNAVLSAIVIDVIPKLPEINVGVVQFRLGGGYNGINNAELNYYGKTWCCWTARPTDEQRKAVKWDG